MWNCFIGCSQGVACPHQCGMPSVCVACAQWVWLVISGCGMSSVGVVCPQWFPGCVSVSSVGVWHGLSGCGIALVGASVGVA